MNFTINGAYRNDNNLIYLRSPCLAENYPPSLREMFMNDDYADPGPKRNELPPDHLNAIGILTRREVEARILAPLLEALGEEFGCQRVEEITRQAIIQVAKGQGAQLAESMGGCTLAHFADSLEAWKKDGALQIEVLEEDEEKFSFNVTRCRYVEMYAELGVPEMGALLSCNRDYALIDGFNPDITLTRTQTIMEGAPFCDFRFMMKGKT